MLVAPLPALVATAALALLSGPAAATAPAPAPVRTTASAGVTVVSSRSLAAAVLVQVNLVRREHGLVPLRLNAALDRAAAEHSVEMGQDGYFQHSSAGGGAFWQRIQRYYPSSGYGYWSVGENLLWASPGVDAPGALDMWMHSPEHRANLLAPRWREIGVSAVEVAAAPGVYHGLDVTIVTTDFGVRS